MTFIAEGAGNVFAVFTTDELSSREPRGGAHFAPPLCSARHLDGVLEVLPLDEGRHGVRMVIWNADGSRPEACGNGLRCVALFARERGLVDSDALVVDTDCGPRRVELQRTDGRITAARVELGRGRIVDINLDLQLPSGRRQACIHVDLGNPHCVIFGDPADLEELGPALVAHPHFPAGTNVEIAAVSDQEGPVRARVWERGVGETAACGTGAAAVALALEATGRGSLPRVVTLPGGGLTIERDANGGVLLTGPVSRGSVPLPGGSPRLNQANQVQP